MIIKKSELRQIIKEAVEDVAATKKPAQPSVLFARDLKRKFKSLFGIPVRIRVSHPKKANPHIQLWTAKEEDIIPNDVRLKAVYAVYGRDAEGVITAGGKDNLEDANKNINLGNIRAHSVVLRFEQWQELMKSFE